jgi:DNA-directed RNA polymerase specialized sigma24 family protein
MSPETHSLSHAQGAALDAAARERCRVWYEQHGAAVYDDVRFQLPEPDAAEDVVADTFVRARLAFFSMEHS